MQNDESSIISISGSPDRMNSRFLRSVCSFILLGVSCLSWLMATGVTSQNGLAAWVMIGISCFVVGIWLPGGEHEFLDIEKRMIVKEKYYFVSWRDETPLSEFEKIVVRHVCHPGGEADDTYTGSVGLKPLRGGPVKWVKGFPATQDEMPTEADRFARELSHLIGLSYAGSNVAA